MAVIYAKKLREESASLERDGERISVTYVVECDTADEDPRDIRLSSYLPQRGDSYDGYGTPVCVGTSIERYEAGESLFTWKATAVYETRSAAPNDALDQPDDPTTWDPEVIWQANEITEEAAVDKDNDPIVNAAGEPFESGPQVFRFNTTLSITKRFAIDRAATVVGFLASVPDSRALVNSDTFYGIIAGRVLWTGWSQRQENINGFEVYAETWTFRVAHSWDKTILNVGFNYLDGGVLKRFKVEDPDTGEKLDSPTPGNLTSGGDDGGTYQTVISFELYPSYAFSGFGL